ncbi:uncharacterized protein LOC127570908 isoform X2 [Pristis pectinata]|uniref:uncharacterized protein LOC127570908 isoform X2 n=1 Tax=Pristis pectinata TaxID=685728 RepID=UPI00223E1205|nr:uncharacterized protein LOC127570908 isoform X2 [Pristis pectinata]
MVGGLGLVTLTSCLLVLSGCSEPKKTMVVLHHNDSSEAEQQHAVCPTMCRCYINILSCHPEGPVGSHAHDQSSSTFESAATTESSRSPHDGSRNHTENATDTLTQVPTGIRGTMSGNVLTPFTVLDFRDNNISFIWKDSWLVYPSVEYLDLSNNNILVLGPGAFSQLSSLHFLNISDNYLSLIGEGAFDHLNSVIYLDLRATSISLDILKSILESTTNIVNLYISHTLKCCLCKFPHLDKLILTRNVEINCKNIFCTVSLIQCYTKEVKKTNVLKDKERIIEEMEAVKAGTVSSLPGDKRGEGSQNKQIKLERSRNSGALALNSTQSQPELGLEVLNKDLQLGEKQSEELKEELLKKNTMLKDKLKSEESARNTQRENLKQINLVKLSSKSERPELPDGGNEENTLGRLHKLKEALKSLYHYASDRIANNSYEQYRVKLES